jgi:hypothetical protein
VIIGPAFSPDTRLNEIEKQKFPNVKFIRNIEDLSLIMAESHIAITALVVLFVSSVTYFYMFGIETLHFVQSDKRCHSEAQPKNLL